MGTPKDSEKTRARLIEAAGSLFAEKGFNGVTVREIVSAANTHLSALNYHFSSKDALYREVLLDACRSDTISQSDQRLLLGLNPGEALFLMVKESLKNYTSQKKNAWRIIILSRECRQPSKAFDEVVESYFRPETDFVARIIASASNRMENDYPVKFAVITMIGLIETFSLYSQLIDAVAPGMDTHYKKKDRLARQITHLVLEAADPKSKHQK